MCSYCIRNSCYFVSPNSVRAVDVRIVFFVVFLRSWCSLKNQTYYTYVRVFTQISTFLRIRTQKERKIQEKVDRSRDTGRHVVPKCIVSLPNFSRCRFTLYGRSPLRNLMVKGYHHIEGIQHRFQRRRRRIRVCLRRRRRRRGERRDRRLGKKKDALICGIYCYPVEVGRAEPTKRVSISAPCSTSF